MIGEIEYLKVLNYRDEKAEVYYVEKNYTNGNIITIYLNHAGAWKEMEWDTIWSSGGSASEMIWPYWWDTLLHGGL